MHLVLDLRTNSGGSPEAVAFLSGYLFDEDGLPLFDIVARSGERTTYSTPDPGPPERDAARPVYVLTAARTFSAGEGFAFLLQERGRANVIGEVTAGAANPGRPYRVNAMFDVVVPNGSVRSAASGGNWKGTGVRPDVHVPASEALSVAHARAVDRLIEAAEGDWRLRLARRVLIELPQAPEPIAFRLLTWPRVWLKVRRSLRLHPAVTLLNRAVYQTGMIVRPEVRVAVTLPPAWGVSKPTAASTNEGNAPSESAPA